MESSSESESGKSKERYGTSYLAMEAALRNPRLAKAVRRRSRGGFKWVLLVLLILGLAAYHYRARIVPWLEQNPQTAPVVQTLREGLGDKPKTEKPEMATTADVARPAGGETTFSSGQGYGIVTPDDGSESFRVVVPSEAENTR